MPDFSNIKISRLATIRRGFMRRMDAIARTLTTLRFFDASVQSADVDATGYKGFYYHFLEMMSGRRVWKCELSTIGSAILLAGMLTAAAYFSGEDEDEREIRALPTRSTCARIGTGRKTTTTR